MDTAHRAWGGEQRAEGIEHRAESYSKQRGETRLGKVSISGFGDLAIIDKDTSENLLVELDSLCRKITNFQNALK
jgi:hypothetical protein